MNQNPDTWSTRTERATDSLIGLFGWIPAVSRALAYRQHFRHMDRDPEYRRYIDAVMRTRGYTKSSEDYSTPWYAGDRRSADAEVIDSLPGLINKSRELSRVDPIGSGLFGSFVRNVIGPEILPQATTDLPSRNARMEAVWAERKDVSAPADDMDAGQAQAMRFQQILETGNLFVKKTKRSRRDPVWFETIEKDRVATPRDLVAGVDTGEGHEVRDGVEKEGWGVPVAYWVCKTHPGDITVSGTALKGKEDFVRVPASEMNHLRLAERPGQTHGVPFLHAVLQDIRDLDLLVLAALKRVQIAACLSVFIQSEEAIADFEQKTARRYGYKLQQMIEPGMIFKLFPDEKISTVIPNFPNSEFAPFILLLARRIGAALGVSWQIVLKDFSDSTYSSARSDLLESRQPWRILTNWYARRQLTWEWRAVLEDARLRGDTRMRGVTDAYIGQVQWIGVGWEWVDPLKEGQAVAIELGLQLTDPYTECAKKGRDYEQVLKASFRAWDYRRKLHAKYGLPEPPPPTGTFDLEALKVVKDDDEEAKPKKQEAA